jgi:NADPH:quinone reductase-like Zn-dependent oxidoreductase
VHLNVSASNMTVGDLPPLQTGIITLPNLTLGVSDTVPTPRLLTDKMIIVATCAMALNPTDFKMPAAFPSPGAVDGADFAGDIVQVGPAVTKWRVGDRVFGAVQGADPKNHQSGAFQQFVPAYEREVLRVPDGMSYETAAAIGGACIGTAALALYCSLGLRPLPGGEACLKPLPVLVYGGSTATGAMAIQLLKW